MRKNGGGMREGQGKGERERRDGMREEGHKKMTAPRGTKRIQGTQDKK